MYETEEQQVEALKKWWKENGKSIIAGIVLGLGAVLGWQGWNDHKDQVGAQASNVYDQMLLSTREENLQAAQTQRDLLHKEFGNTPYAAFADMLLAKLQLGSGDAQAAMASLQSALDHAPDPAIQSIVLLRLARLKLSQGDLNGAEALAAQSADAAYAGEFAALRGDIAKAQGNAYKARAAYQEALAGEVSNAELVQLKLDSLPPAS